jgi:hypothetical protein
LPIPVGQEFILGAQKQKKTGFLRISFFPVFSKGFFHRNMVLEGVAGIPDFCHCHRIFFAGIPAGQESLYLLRIPQDSSGFLRITVPSKRCLALASDYNCFYVK